MKQRTVIIPKNLLIVPVYDSLTMTQIGAIYSLGTWTVKPGNETAFAEAWGVFARWTAMNQKGAQTAVLVQDLENPRRFISFGPWEDTDAIKQWRNTPEFKKAFETFRDLCSEIQPHTMRVVESSG
jgi:heme-degrading monooxygenase HmoA